MPLSLSYSIPNSSRKNVCASLRRATSPAFIFLQSAFLFGYALVFAAGLLGVAKRHQSILAVSAQPPTNLAPGVAEHVGGLLLALALPSFQQAKHLQAVSHRTIRGTPLFERSQFVGGFGDFFGVVDPHSSRE